jgi:hypothetical protein
LRVEHAAQMTARDADARGERLDAALLEHAVFDELHGSLCETRGRVDAREPRSELRPASQAGPEALDLRRGGTHEEAAVLAARQADVADRPAIDPRRAHADEEASVEARIVRREGAIATVGIENHARIMRRRRGRDSPFPDIEIGSLEPRQDPPAVRCIA